MSKVVYNLMDQPVLWINFNLAIPIAQLDKRDPDTSDEDEEEEEGRKGKSGAEEIDPAQFAWPTYLTAGTIFGSVFRVDLTKVRVDVETNDLSEQSIVVNLSFFPRGI